MKKFQKLYQLKQIVKNDSPLESIKEARRNLISGGGSRLLHIAYSLLKCKSYQQIENSVREQNQLKDYQWKQIIDIMSKYKDEENTCTIPSSPFPTTKVNLPKAKKVEATNE